MLADKRVLVLAMANTKAKESNKDSATLLSKDSLGANSRGDVTAKKSNSKRNAGLRGSAAGGAGAGGGASTGTGAGQLFVTVVGASMEVPTTQGMSCCIW